MKVLRVGCPPRGRASGLAAGAGRTPAWLTSAWRRLGLCLLFLLLFAAPAYAGPQAPDDGCLTDEECQNHYSSAIKLFQDGRFETALPEFQAAYQRRQMPWLLVNIGRTLHRLGRSREALEHYERYKQAETKPDPETQERVEKYIAQARVLTGTPTAPTKETPSGSDQPQPLYKKWWFWTAIGGGVVAIVIIGAAAGAASSSSAPRGIPTDVPKVAFSF